MSKKIAINARHGGFGLSDAAVRAYAARKGLTLYPEQTRFSSLCGPTYWIVPEEERVGLVEDEAWYAASQEARIASNKAHQEMTINDRDLPRDDPDLIAVIETLGDEANGLCAKLEVREIPDDVEWEIAEYDGLEWIAEKHRTW